MISARMDRQITVEYPNTSTNDYGEETTEWLELATVWAEVRQQSGREIWQGGKIAEMDAMFRIRNLPGLGKDCRIYYDGHPYDISSIKEIGRSEGHEIMAKAQD